MILPLARTHLNKIAFCVTMGLLIIALLGCHKDTPPVPETVEEIQRLHAQLQDGTADSMGLWLDELEYTQRGFSIPDSLAEQTCFYRGLYLFQQKQLDTATTLFEQAISFIRPPISGSQIEYFRIAWTAYSRQGEYGESLALSNTLESLLGDDSSPRKKSLLYFIREDAYRQQDSFEQAIYYNNLYVEQLELLRDTQRIAQAIIHQALYSYYHYQDVERTFAILDRLVEREHLYSSYTNRLIHGEYGVYLFYEGDYKGALASYKRGLAELQKTKGEANNGVFLAEAYSNIAETYIQLGDFERAQMYLDSVYDLGLNSISEDVRKNTLRYQLELVYRDGQGLEPIMKALDSILWYQDQQFLQRNQSELKALKLANEKEKTLLERNKEEELKNLRLRLSQTLSLVVFIIIIWIGYLLYRQRKLRFEKQELQLQQRLLRTQMNPHFTFNTLYAIQTLIKKDPQKAITYQLKFSRLLRLVLENSTANFVQLDDELVAVEQYLELQLLRFPGKFQYEILLEDIARDSLIFIPPMLMQPMIENCIEHGFAGIDYTGVITIRLSTHKNGLLFCSIEDNGLGVQTEKYRLSQAKSTELIDAFLKKLTPDGLRLTNKAARKTGESGVLVEFLIPCKTTPNG